MDTIKYLNAFSRLLRWNLSKADAEEALADYKEMLAPYSGKQTSDLIEHFGTPAQAAKLLRDPRSYHLWLAAFCSMLLCLLLPEIALFKTNSFHPLMVPAIIFLFVLGLLLALIWFFPRQGRQKTPMPKGLAPALLGLLAITATGSAVLAECVLVLVLLCSTSLDGSLAGWLACPAAKLGVLGIAGLAATGVSLC